MVKHKYAEFNDSLNNVLKHSWPRGRNCFGGLRGGPGSGKKPVCRAKDFIRDDDRVYFRGGDCDYRPFDSV